MSNLKAAIPQMATNPTGRLPHAIATAPARGLHPHHAEARAERVTTEVERLVHEGYADPSITPGTFPLTPVDDVVRAAISAAAPLRSEAGEWGDVEAGYSDVAFHVAVEAMALTLRSSKRRNITVNGLRAALQMIVDEVGR
ncbi:hypothetical protein PV350_13900 [Streptomyces sp. PA03-6a]|nr:hypothetical protein [Streptomyces sp. PA03-6a]